MSERPMTHAALSLAADGRWQGDRDSLRRQLAIVEKEARSGDDPDEQSPGVTRAGARHPRSVPADSAGALLREALAKAYEPGNSPQWRSGYLYAERIALAVLQASAPSPAAESDED